jgi:hypothetical protein
MGLGWVLAQGMGLGWVLAQGMGLGWVLAQGMGLGWVLAQGMGLGWVLAQGMGWGLATGRDIRGGWDIGGGLGYRDLGIYLTRRLGMREGSNMECPGTLRLRLRIHRPGWEWAPRARAHHRCHHYTIPRNLCSMSYQKSRRHHQETRRVPGRQVSVDRCRQGRFH